VQWEYVPFAEMIGKEKRGSADEPYMEGLRDWSLSPQRSPSPATVSSLDPWHSGACSVHTEELIGRIGEACTA
jgi:hypothetical protein